MQAIAVGCHRCAFYPKKSSAAIVNDQAAFGPLHPNAVKVCEYRLLSVQGAYSIQLCLSNCCHTANAMMLYSQDKSKVNVAAAAATALDTSCYSGPEMASYQNSDGPAVIAVVHMLGLAASWLDSKEPWLDSQSHVSQEGKPTFTPLLCNLCCQHVWVCCSHTAAAPQFFMLVSTTRCHSCPN